MTTVLFVSHSSEIGGGERVLLDLLAQLDRERVRPFVATLADGPLTERARALGVETAVIGPPFRFTRRSGPADALAAAARVARVVAGLARFVRSRGVEVICTNSAKAHVYGGLAGRLTGRPVVARLHDIVAAPAFGQLSRRLLALALGRLARRVLPVSDACAAPLAALGVPPGSVRVLRGGAPPRPRATRADARAALGLSEGAYVLASVGRLTRWKGQHLLLETLPRLAARHPEVQALFFGEAQGGDGAYRDELRRTIAAGGLADRVCLAGYRDDARELLPACDVLVHTAIEPDPLPTVLLEAVAARVFVVAADAGGVPEIVREPGVGLRYPPGDAAALGRTLERVISDRARADEEASARVLERFSARDYVSAMEEELTSAAAARSAG